jgi:hypothetical protein
MCKCGCNTCETKTQGPLLTEGKVKSLLSEGLQYHIDKKIPLFETVYRIGSDKHLALIKEARKMYSRNVIDLCEEDEALIKTHLGEFGIYEGESVPLDLPMLNEVVVDYDFSERELIRVLKQLKRGASTEIDMIKAFTKALGRDLTKDELFETYSGFIRNPEDPDSEPFEPTGTVAQFREELRALFGKFKGDLRNPEFIKGVAQIMVNWKSLLRSQLGEAEFRGKDVSLNKPKRGGSKAYYVYVRDPKTKKIKKVSFGSGGLRAKIKNKTARNAFAKRHNCDQKKDRTKAGYWSCNLPRYASALGLGANMNTYW